MFNWIRNLFMVVDSMENKETDRCVLTPREREAIARDAEAYLRKRFPEWFGTKNKTQNETSEEVENDGKQNTEQFDLSQFDEETINSPEFKDAFELLQSLLQGIDSSCFSEGCEQVESHD